MDHSSYERLTFREPRSTMILPVGSRSHEKPALAAYSLRITGSCWRSASQRFDIRGTSHSLAA